MSSLNAADAATSSKIAEAMLGNNLKGLTPSEKALAAFCILNNFAWHTSNWQKAATDTTRVDPSKRNNVFNVYSDNLRHANKRGGINDVIDMMISDAYNAGKPGVGELRRPGRQEQGSSSLETQEIHTQIPETGEGGGSAGGSVNATNAQQQDALFGIKTRPTTLGELMGAREFIDSAIAGTHHRWLERSKSEPGVRQKGDDVASLNAHLKLLGTSVDGLNLADLLSELKSNGVPFGSQNRAFAFQVDENLNPVAKNDKEANLLTLFGPDSVKKVILANNQPAVEGVVATIAGILGGQQPNVITNSEGYEQATKDGYTATRNANISDIEINANKLNELRSELVGYAAFLKENAGDKSIGEIKVPPQLARAHAIAGKIHDDFVGFRKQGGHYIDDSQVVPYDQLKIGVAELDLDPVLATLDAALSSVGAQRRGREIGQDELIKLRQGIQLNQSTETIARGLEFESVTATDVERIEGEWEDPPANLFGTWRSKQ